MRARVACFGGLLIHTEFLGIVGIFLQILGGCCLAFVVLCGILALYVGLKVRGFFTSLKKMARAGSANPRKVTLEAMPHPRWDDDKAARAAVAILEREGYRPIGAFRVVEIHSLTMQAFVSDADNAYAVVSEVPDAAGVWCEAVRFYDDETSLCVSNMREIGAPDQPPTAQRVNVPGATTEAMLAEFRSTLQRDKPSPVHRAEDFVTRFQDAYTRVMDWRAARGGASEAEVRRVMLAGGVTATDEQVALTVESQRQLANEHLREAIVDQLLTARSMTSTDWQQVADRHLIVHDRLTFQDLASLVAEATSDQPDVEVPNVPDPDARPGRELFADMNSRLPESCRFELVAEFANPIAAQVWRRR